MALTIFESRQLVKELIDQAKRLWENTDHADKVEGLADDPAFRMLFSALAYHLSLIDKEITSLKADVLNDYADYLSPPQGVRALPATMVIKTNLVDGVDELEVSHNSRFALRDNNIDFSPILNTKVINIKECVIARLDGRRWKVNLKFSAPIKNLHGFSFAVTGCNFRRLKATVQGRNMRLITPWQLSEQPYSHYFSIDTMLYNNQQVYDPSNVSMDLFARQNVTNFIVDDFPLNDRSQYGEDCVEMILEFFSISPSFVFDKTKLQLNTIILANVTSHSVELSPQRPIARIADCNAAKPNADGKAPDFFMHLLPTGMPTISHDNVIVRTYATERFNSLSLLKLINLILAKIDSDRSAFSALPAHQTDNLIISLRAIMRELRQALAEDLKSGQSQGVYLSFRDNSQKTPKTITYLTTAGAAVNKYLAGNPLYMLPVGLNLQETAPIAEPQQGVAPNNDSANLLAMSQYLFATGDRLVTPADIKMFCLAVLQTSYALDRKLIKSVTIDHRPIPGDRMMGYEIIVDILIEDNPFVRKALGDDIERIEITLEKLIQVRSTNIYPIRTNIKVGQ